MPPSTFYLLLRVDKESKGDALLISRNSTPSPKIECFMNTKSSLIVEYTKYSLNVNRRTELSPKSLMDATSCETVSYPNGSVVLQ